jgi:hypothetical protein
MTRSATHFKRTLLTSVAIVAAAATVGVLNAAPAHASSAGINYLVAITQMKADNANEQANTATTATTKPATTATTTTVTPK